MQKIKKSNATVFVLALMLIIATLVSGCLSKSEEKIEATPTANTDVTPTAVATTPVINSTPAKVEITEATDDMLAKYANYDEFDASIDEYGIKLLLTTDTNVRILRVYTLKYDEATQGMAEDAELYQQNELTPDKPLVLIASFPGSMPPIGFEFTDTDGMIKKYDIYMSGMDGSIQLEEITD